MKKFWFYLAAAVPFAAMALASGEKAAALQIDALKNEPVYLDDNSFSADSPYNHLRIVTAFATFLPESATKLEMLDALSAKYADRDLQCIAFSPEPRPTLEAFIAPLAIAKIEIAHDPEGKTANEYLDGAMVTNRAFVVDADQTILWDGDPDDLPRVLSAMYADKFNASSFRAVSGWQQELTVAIASGNMPEIMHNAERILQSDPENSIGLRGYLYAAEYLEKPAVAFDFLSKLLAAHPDCQKLYFALIEQCRKDDALLDKAWPLAGEFGTRFASEPAAVNRMAWALLNTFPTRAGALGAVRKMVGNLEAAPESAEILTTLAMYRSRVGDLAGAISLQAKAVELAPPADRPTLQGFLDFYREAAAK